MAQLDTDFRLNKRDFKYKYIVSNDTVGATGHKSIFSSLFLPLYRKCNLITFFALNGLANNG